MHGERSVYNRGTCRSLPRSSSHSSPRARSRCTPRRTSAPSCFAAPALAGGLTDSAQLAAAYDAILASRDRDAEALLARACPPAPAAACADLPPVMLWWDIQQDLSTRTLDERFEASAGTAVATATVATEKEPNRAEHWFYLAAAYAPLAQWRILRGERLTAARDGKTHQDALERALALDPGPGRLVRDRSLSLLRGCCASGA